MAQTVPTLKLNTGAPIPQIGYGVFQVPADQVVEPVRTALEAGYRLIDTAAAYGNEKGVGQAVRESGVPREEIFVTTKLWNSDQGGERAGAAFDASLRRLGLDYVDLYLIHWPTPSRDLYLETWETLAKVVADGRARAIGVSNFNVAHLERVISATGVTPAANQVELHPGLPQAELRAFHESHGIVTESWGPIGQGKGLLEEAAVRRVAEETGRTPAQVVLRWHVQLGNTVPLPKSVHAERIRENLAVFDFELTAGQMAALDGLGTDNRLGPDPEKFDLA